MSNVQIIHGDCMTAMASMKDKAFELAIVDPPYGVNIGSKVAERERERISVGGGKPFGKGRGGKVIFPKIYRGFDDSRIPEQKYFTELMRISENQIIFGGNYFIQHLTNTSCFIVWDKDNTGNFADCELAWTSFKTATRKFTFRWNGMLQQNMKHKQERIHPTQKPIDLYMWLLKNYAKPGDRILDTHLGSGSSAIAADIMGYDFTGYEIDEDYYKAALDRFNRHKQQCVLEFA